MKYKIPMCKQYYFDNHPHCRVKRSRWATLLCHEVNRECPDYEPSETNIKPINNELLDCNEEQSG